jgi:DNA-binding MarR family transcriptional regulator
MSDVLHTQAQRIPIAGLLEAARDAVLAEFEAELAANGYGDIRPTHGCAFRFVREDGIRLTELAHLASLTKQSTGEVVDDLVDLGYVERVPDPDDRRAKLIRLTERGQEARRVGFGLFAKLEESWGELFGAERIAELRKTLEDIVTVKAPEAVPELAHPEPAGVK